jgi:hypothetical protein
MQESRRIKCKKCKNQEESRRIKKNQKKNQKESKRIKISVPKTVVVQPHSISDFPKPLTG